MPVSKAELRNLALTRHVIYVLVASLVILPYIHELPLPFKPRPWAEKLYGQVDALEPGSHVLLAFDYSPGSEAELYPMSLAILRHCFKKDLVPVVLTLWPDGVGLSRRLCETAAAESKELWGKEKVSGRDYVFLGYKPGYANLVLNMGESLKGAFAADYYKQPTQGMLALTGVESLKDIDLAIDIASGNTIDQIWIPYGADQFGFPLGAGCTAVMAPDMYPFLQSGQLVGFLGGLRGAADYEQLLTKPADATRGMQAQTTSHLLLIVLIVTANVMFIVRRVRAGKGN